MLGFHASQVRIAICAVARRPVERCAAGCCPRVRLGPGRGAGWEDRTVELMESLRLLAEQNMSGVAFLTAYGVTWLVCGGLWQRASERVAAFATLFQGMVAFPAALGLSALSGAIGQ